MMKRMLLCSLLATAGLTAEATEITFTSDLDFRQLYVFAEGEAVPVSVTEPQTSSTTLDLAPGRYYVAATLDSDDGNTYPLGAMKTFTVSDTPTTVSYTTSENYVPVRFTVTDENGHPLKGIAIDAGADDFSYVRFEYSFHAETGDDGTVTALAAPGMSFLCSTSDPGQHYTSLQQRFSTGSEGIDVALSYTGYHCISLTVTGYYVPEWDDPANFSGSATLTDGNQFAFNLNNGGTGHTLWAVVPDGRYDLLLRSQHDEEGYEVVATTPLVVNGADVEQTVDLSGARKVSFAPDDLSGDFTLYATNGDRRVALTTGTNRTYLLPGSYELAGAFYDMATERRYIFGHPFHVTDAALTVSVATDHALYHDVTLDVSTARGKAGYQAYVNGSEVAYAEGFIKSLPAIADGSYTYTVTNVWVDKTQYVLPLTQEGTFTVSGADVTVPVDLTDHRFFTLHYTRDGKDFDFSNMNLTDSEGRTVHVEQGGLSGVRFGLRPGTYRINGTLEFDLTGSVSGTLTVPDDCPAELTVDFTGKPTGIADAHAETLTLRVTTDGLQVGAAPGTATLDLYDTTGRRVLSKPATGGATISTTHLPAGVYIARLRQGATTRNLKFAIR